MEVCTTDESSEFAVVEECKLQKTYRVETFIIPVTNQIYRSMDELHVNCSYQGIEMESEVCETDDLKIVCKQKMAEVLERSIIQSDTEIDNTRETNCVSDRSNSITEIVPADNFLRDAELNLSGELMQNSKSTEVVVQKPWVMEDQLIGPLVAADNNSVNNSEEMIDFDFNTIDDSLSNFERPRLFTEMHRLKSRSYDLLPSPRVGSDLAAINESCEIAYGSHEDFCHHGYKNGCSVVTQSPNQVSEDIFKENWMRRLEFLRQRVTLLKEKEVVLQERERLLLKKEKELRILERLAREKIQKADLYLKRYSRNSLNLERELIDVERCANGKNIFQARVSPYLDLDRWTNMAHKTESHPGLDSRNSNCSTQSKESVHSNPMDTTDNSKRPSHLEVPKGHHNADKPPRRIPSTTPLVPSDHFEKCRSTNVRTMQIAKSQAIPSDASYPKDNGNKFITGDGNLFANQSQIRDSQAISLDSMSELRKSKWSAYSSWRSKPRPKVSYDDLDSTLSADIGDSSFVVTSKKLDPRLVQKPRLFTRSASERGPKTRAMPHENVEQCMVDGGDKVLRKINENISAVAQYQGTRFQDYGSIDSKETRKSTLEHEAPGNIREEELPRSKSTDTSSNGKSDAKIHAEAKPKNKETVTKPNFWNEEASEWLRKKRQAYNMATKKELSKDSRNKENCANGTSCQTLSAIDKSKKKNDKGKKFTIFR